MNKKILTIIFVILFKNFLNAQTVYPGDVNILEQPKLIFDYSLDKSPTNTTTKIDAAFGAFRDSSNQIRIWSATGETGHYTLRTNNFDTFWVDWSWGKVFSSSKDLTLKNYNYMEWLMTPYTSDGKKYYGLVHNEYHAWEDPTSKHYNNISIWQNLWYNAITFAQSTDGGKNFTQSAPPTSHLVLSPTNKYDDNLIQRQGFFGPSNIIYNKQDGYYYSIVEAYPYEYQKHGLCVMRTKTINEPKSWRGWNGTTFAAVDTLNPYTQTITVTQKKAAALEPVIPYGIAGVRLSYNTYFNRYMISGTMKSGFYYSLSSDLIHWSPKKLIIKMNGSNAPDSIPSLMFGDYPSIIDPTDTSRNFEYTGKDVYLFFSRAASEHGSKIYRMKISFSFGTAPSTSLTVNTTNDDDDYELADGLPLTSKGEISLRSAITESSFRMTGNGWADSVYKITFASGINKIKLIEAPEVSSYPILIDGLQNGGSANTQNFNQGMNLVPGVEIDCNQFHGLFINGGNSTIRGLNIYNYSGDGGVSFYLKGSNKLESNIIGADKSGTIYKGSLSAVSIDESPSNIIGGLTNDKRNLLAGGVYVSGTTSKNNLVQGNYIGTDLTGLKSIGVPGPGIQLSAKANLTTIGGTNISARNLISGNGGNGIEIFGVGSANNKILYNFIGVDRTGIATLGNKGNGIEIDDYASINTIGQPLAGNVISGNGSGYEAGIYLSYNNDNNIIQSNFIGTDTTQTYSLPNKKYGIAISALSGLNKIGNLTTGAGNIIANNDGPGIMLENSVDIVNNSIISNQIYNNKNFDIDLGNDGITKNDSLDKDIGPNNLINFPVLESITQISNGINLKGSFSGEATKSILIEFFASNIKKSSGYGNAKKYLGSTNVTTNSSGTATFDLNLTTSIDTSYFVTATATQYTGTTYYNTSEFSRQLKVGKVKVVIANNSAPKITNKLNSPFVVNIGTQFSKQFFATDKDTLLGDELLWEVKHFQAHPWINIDENGVLSGMPDNDFGETNWWDANIKITDLGGLTDFTAIELLVNPAWPKFTSTPYDTISPSQNQNYQIVIKDSLGATQTGFTYGVVTNPGFVTVTTAGLVKISPVFQHSGKTFDVLITASKGGIPIYQFWKVEVKNVNIAPLWENNRLIKIPNTTTQTFYYSPGYDTTIHKDSLITFRVVPASDMNSSDTLVYTYKIYDPNGTLVTSIVADKYNKADSIKYGARETKCVAISNIGTQLQVGILYEVRVSVSDGKVISNIPTPYPRFRVSSSNTQTASITVSKTALSFGSITVGIKSTLQSITVGGTSLGGNITITPPAGYEIRTGTNEFSTNVITLTQASGAVNQTNIDVRFAPTAAQQYNVSIKIQSTGAIDKDVAVSGTGTTSVSPTVTVSDTLIEFGNNIVGTISQTESFSLLGNNLLGSISILPPIGFEIRTGSNTFSSNAINLTPVNGSVSQTTIDLIFKATIQKDYFDTIKVSFTSSNEINNSSSAEEKFTSKKEINNLNANNFTTLGTSQKIIIVKGTGTVAANNPPTIISIAEATVIENTLYKYQVVATDPDTVTGDKLTYSFETKPSWLSISNTGLVSGTPLLKNVGDTSFTVKVSDSQGASITQKTKLKVLKESYSISIYSISPTNGPVGSTVLITGANFSSTLSKNTVWFGGVKANVLSSTTQELKVEVPISAGYSFPVVSVNGAQITSPKAFNSTFLGTDVPYLSSNLGTDAVPVTTGNFPVKSLLADFDDDGRQELVVVNYGGGNGVSSLYIYPNNIPVKGKIEVSQFSSPIILTPGTNPNGIAIGDIDGDGMLDIAVSNFWSYNVSIFRNIHSSGNLTASSFATKQDLTVSSNGKPGDVALSDLNGDGMLDLIVTDFNSVAELGAAVFKNTSTPSSISFASQLNFATGKNPKRIGVANANGDSKPDLFIVSENSLSSNITYLQNKSTLDSISFETKVEIPTAKNPRDIAFADFNNDGFTDFVIPNYEVDSLTVYQNTTSTSSTNFNSTYKIKVPFPYTYPNSVTTGDINGDGWIDLVYGSWGYQSAPHYLNTKSTGNINNNSFAQKSYNITFLNNPTSVTLGDLNSDGKPELIVTASASDKVGIFRNRIGSSLSISQKIISSFGNVLIGSSKSAAVTITNTGDDTLKITKWVSLVDNFKVKEVGSGAFILPSASHIDSIWFTPLSIGAKKGKIVIETNGGFDTIYVEGIGTGKAILSLSTNNLDFGNVKLNDSKKLSVKLKNSGNDTLFIKTLTLFGSTEFSYAQLPSGGVAMLPLQEQDFEVTAKPTNLGLRNAMLKIFHNVGVDSIKFTMKASGEPKIKLSVTKIDFGSVKQHLTKDTTFAIQNLGNDTLHIEKMELTNSQFSFGSTSTKRSIAPSDKSDEKITFKPLQNLGSVIGKLFITSNNLNVVTKDSVELVANVVTKVPIGVEIPTVFSLSQNFPNPFNPATTIKFGLPNESYVKLEIYNSLGQLVNTLIDEKLSAHFYEIKWEAGNLPTGMYFYKIIAVDLSDQNNKLIQTRKMILMK